MKLYEIKDSFRNWLEKVQETEGEVTPELMTELNGINEDFDIKAEAYAIIIKELEADSKALKAEKQRIEERQARATNLAEKLSQSLAEAMALLGKEKFETAKCKVSFRSSTVVNITDETLIPEDYMQVKKTPMKADIKEAIKNGLIIQGAELVENKNIQIK